ncbi:MAG: DNA polymerase III subunit alpha [Planctomycetota bacterium]|nr:DNA polymerase III subunit alpha [Planctomycetota bacterium]
MGQDRARPGEFTHLHLHTEYSLLDGGNQVEKLVARVAELGMKACAITDHGNLFGTAAFYLACKDKGIKPILGCEAYVTPPGKPRTDRTYSGGGEGGFHLVLLAETNEGWRNLLVLASEAYLTGFYYKPRIDRELLEVHSAGLIAINGHLGSEIGDHLLAYHRSRDEKYWALARESAEWHARVFNRAGSPPRFFVELQHHIPEQNAINPHLIRLAREIGAPLVCDNDAHFLKADDHDAHDTLICISTGKGKEDTNRLRYPRDLYVKSPAEMEAMFEAYADAGREALDNAASIADRCAVDLPLGANNSPAVQIDVPGPGTLPDPADPAFAGDLTAWYKAYCAAFELRPFTTAPTPEQTAKANADCDAALRMLAEAGFRWRYGHAPGADEKSQRLERELGILAGKKISAYFLIVWDFVNWGRQRAIPANARGSGVGTMVGYVLGLSNACPVQYGLLFERFTDPDRSEYPDIDIDLCQDGRAAVIDYVRRKYGHVAQIITFGTLKARAAIRDVGRVLEIPLPDVDRVAKLVPEQLNITIEEALEKEPELRRLAASEPRFQRLLDNAVQLEGHTRHAGVHAAGVIVATRPLHEIVPLYKQPGTEGLDAIITQWDGPTCEKMGLLKMDFLGLRTLSVIERAKALIRATIAEEDVWAGVGRRPTDGGPHPLDLDRLAYDDQRVFELFRRGETTGIFQFESGGMRRLLVEMKPDRLEDLIAANALFRPGPMDLIPDYNRRKHGTEPVPQVHDIVDAFTRETYGVMVYQEQVMQIVHGLGGISLRDAYTLIKNISKKKEDKIAKERPKFVKGAQAHGLSEKNAEDLFELILKFAGYGFNKSHSTGYAIVAYQTAYLKTYFPAQYMAAFLTYESQANKVSEWIPYLDDCRRTRVVDPASGVTIRTGIEVKPPDINLSQADFTVVRAEADGHPHIRFGLKALKGAGDKAIEAIIRERERGGVFTSLFDFCERLPPGVLTRPTIESLVRSGAFDAIHGRPQRAAVIATIDQALGAGANIAADKAAGQGGLFFGPADAPAKRAGVTPPLARVEPWSEAETLRQEKEALGFYVSSHPLERWRAWGQVFATSTTAGLKDLPQDARVVLYAMVQSVRTIVVRNGRSAGQKMGIVTVEDLSGSCDSVLFTDAFVRYGHLAEAEKVVFVLGRLDHSRGDAQVIVDRLVPIDGVPVDAGRLRLFVDEVRLNGQAEAAVSRLAEIVRGGAATAPPAAESLKEPGGPALFGVEIVIGTEHQVATLAADARLRVALAPDMLPQFEAALGPGMVKVAGTTIEKPENPKPRWKNRRDED